MKLSSKPDDLCGTCGHSWANHRGFIFCHASRCPCDEFVPPLVARLVEALECYFRSEFTRTDGTIGRGPVREHLDLLVECGRMTKEGDVYRWKEAT